MLSGDQQITNRRVIHIIPSPDGGGAERLVRELTDRLPAFGIDSRAIYFSNPRGVDLTGREFDLGLHGARDLRAIFRLKYALKNQLSTRERLIVHSHLTGPLYFSPLALAGLSVLTVYTEHSTHNKRRDYRLLQPLERVVYRKYQKIACISQATKSALDAWLGEDASDHLTEVVQNGSRLLPFFARSRLGRTGVRLLSVGSLTRHKGFDIALRAVASLGNHIDQYTIVGEGSERAMLEALIQQLGIRDKVSLPGYVDDVTAYLHNADLGLIPSRWEGFSLVAVEALSTGLPLVASNVDGMREVLTGCSAARLTEPEDAIALADGIIYALKNLVGNSEIALEARRHAERYGIGPMVKSYADFYKQIWNENRHIK
jgi:glycosyltransferase involved in cell wall biosynthesis